MRPWPAFLPGGRWENAPQRLHTEDDLTRVQPLCDDGQRRGGALGRRERRTSVSERGSEGRALRSAGDEPDISTRRASRRSSASPGGGDEAGGRSGGQAGHGPVSYTHLRAHETRHDLVCRLLLEKKKK